LLTTTAHIATDGSGTKSNLIHGTKLPRSSHSKTSVCPSRNGCSCSKVYRKVQKFIYLYPQKSTLWENRAARCTAIVHESVGSATSNDNDARCWRDLTMCVGRTGTCTPDDRAGRHPDQISLFCPRGDCVTCATNQLES
jgi:hypothetical protein